MKTVLKLGGVVLALASLNVWTDTVQAQPTPVREATAAEMTAGTQGLPAVVTPRRAGTQVQAAISNAVANATVFVDVTNGSDTAWAYFDRTKAVKTLTNAFALATNNGNIIVVLPGKYLVPTNLVFAAPNMQLVGVGNPTLSDAGGNFPLANGTSTKTSMFFVGVNSTFMGLTITNFLTTQFGVQPYGFTNLVLNGNTIGSGASDWIYYNTTPYGLLFESGSVMNNNIKGNYGAYAMGGLSGGNWYSQNNIIYWDGNGNCPQFDFPFPCTYTTIGDTYTFTNDNSANLSGMNGVFTFAPNSILSMSGATIITTNSSIDYLFGKNRSGTSGSYFDYFKGIAISIGPDAAYWATNSLTTNVVTSYNFTNIVVGGDTNAAINNTYTLSNTISGILMSLTCVATWTNNSITNLTIRLNDPNGNAAEGGHNIFIYTNNTELRVATAGSPTTNSTISAGNWFDPGYNDTMTTYAAPLTNTPVTNIVINAKPSVLNNAFNTDNTNIFSAYPITIASNTWNLQSATNGMGIGSFRIKDSNGVPVLLWMRANGVLTISNLVNSAAP